MGKPGWADTSRVEQFFKQYCDSSGEGVDADGIEKLCCDIGVSTLDPVTLSLCHACNANQMGYFSKQEFVSGMQGLRCDSLESLQRMIPLMRTELQDRIVCKSIYSFTFNFALEENQKALPPSLCCEFWKLLLPAHFARLPEWITYVENNVKNNITKDTWLMVYDLATQCEADLSDYDVDGAWPVLLDDFIEHIRQQELQMS